MAPNKDSIGLAKAYFENDFPHENAEAAFRMRASAGRAVLNLGAGRGNGDAASQRVVQKHEEGARMAVWENIYATRGRLQYRPRSFIALAFPEIAAKLSNGQQGIIVDLGCGSGASILPLVDLLREWGAKATCVDLSSTALGLLANCSQFDANICNLVHADLCGDTSHLAGNHDVALLVFVLSAVPPELQPVALCNAASTLAPGGVLLIRDYGLYDLKQTSEEGTCQVMGDGSLRTFYSTEALEALVLATPGLTLASPARYLTVKLRNRKDGLDLHRVFIRVACIKT